MAVSLFISDLHLDPARPEGIQMFKDFVRKKAANADQLFILGDLFEYWLGDDACQHSGYQAIAESLAELAKHNTKTFFMHGNRDFLAGNDFAKAIDGDLLTDPTLFQLGNLDALLMHGDSLCTDDVEHQKFRTLSRSKEWREDILARSIQEREGIARQLRINSEQGNKEKAESIMDVNQGAVETAMLEQNCNLLIHGHTHRTAIHEFQLGSKSAYRIVLGDWYHKGNYLIHNSNEFSLISYPDDTVIASVKIPAES